MVKFQVDESGKRRVYRLVPNHNHELAKPEERHFLRYARSVTAAKMSSVFTTLLDAGIKTTEVSAYLFDEGTAIENVKFSKEGQELINSQRLTEVDPGDSQSMVNLLKERAAQDTISKNAHSHVHNFISDKERKGLFYKCLQECDSEIEFEETRRRMLSKGNLEGHERLRYLYGSRKKKWSAAFNKDTFGLGIKSVQRTGANSNALNVVPNTSSLTSQWEFL